MIGFASNPVIYNVALVNANTEYALTLPEGCTHFEFQAREGVPVTFSFRPGTPKITLKPGSSYSSYNLWGAQTLTLYFSSTASNVTVELVAWR